MAWDGLVLRADDPWWDYHYPTLAKAIAGRGPEGTINFKTSSDRVHLFFPHVIGERNTLESLATHAAGLRMKTDVDHGYWFSTSNRQLKGVIGVEIPLTARVDDIQSETNRLNAVGITTVFNSFGTGFLLWGNRLACYPIVTHITNFEVVQRTADIIDESIRRVELQFIDKPIDDTLKIVTRGESQQQIDARANAALAEQTDDQQAGNITVIGNPKLVAGNTILLTGFGFFSGKYLIKSARHNYSKGQGYTTSLEVRMLEFIEDLPTTSGQI